MLARDVSRLDAGLKICRKGQSMFWPLKMSHSFIQNCCCITLQNMKDLCQEMEGKTSYRPSNIVKALSMYHIFQISIEISTVASPELLGLKLANGLRLLYTSVLRIVGWVAGRASAMYKDWELVCWWQVIGLQPRLEITCTCFVWQAELTYIPSDIKD